MGTDTGEASVYAGCTDTGGSGLGEQRSRRSRIATYQYVPTFNVGSRVPQEAAKGSPVPGGKLGRDGLTDDAANTRGRNNQGRFHRREVTRV